MARPRTKAGANAQPRGVRAAVDTSAGRKVSGLTERGAGEQPFLDDGLVRVRGAREHNLRSVDVDVPRHALVVFSGISGSGKSSLAFGTLYAEAQRRYLESVSPYARRLIDQVGAPAVDSIEGLPPAVGLQQARGAVSSRSSVGSVTTLSSLLRMLFSRAGTYPPGQPMLYAEDFSPNTPQGACPTCHGVGKVYDATEKSMVPDTSLSIRERAVAAWPTAWQGQNLRDILVTLGYDVDVPWRQLPKQQRDWILFTTEMPTVPVYAGFTPSETRTALRRKSEPSYMGTFTGARAYLLRTFASSGSPMMRRRASRYLIGALCPACKGKRLKPEALTVHFCGVDIGDLASWPMSRLADLLSDAAHGRFRKADAGGQTFSAESIRATKALRAAQGETGHAGAPNIRRTANLSEEKRVAAQRLASDLVSRIETMQGLGLGYLSMDRSTPTLSPGELQRLRLATQIHSNLFGVVYVLDEPSAGLHPTDTEALLRAFEQLKRAGNSLFVVEHNLDVLRKADWLVDVGPGAGSEGGQVLYSGKPEGLENVEASRTRAFLFRTNGVAAHIPREPIGWLKLDDVRINNLVGLDVRIPLGVLTSVTGVSGSGKSSLVSHALVELVCEALGHEPSVSTSRAEEDVGDEELSLRCSGNLGGDIGLLTRIVRVDQKPIGRTPRSNLATYTGLFDTVRNLFAEVPLARQRRYDAGRFSFNVVKGRCATCQGEGFVSVELLFMPSVYAPCPACHGARYNEKTLDVLWNGKNIAEVLNLTVRDALRFFANERGVAKPLALLNKIGLGYLRLGQPATELSGGEAQRIKLATELQRASSGTTIYILDEPSTGLHPSDVELVMTLLNELVSVGNTVVIVEHSMSVIAASDWVIDMGPGAGAEGGSIVAEGAPKDVAMCPRGSTAHFLADYIH